MKIWIVEEEIIREFDEWTPQNMWTGIEKIFDSKDKAISYVRERIKNAIDEQKKEPDPDVVKIIDHMPTDEELLDRVGCWYKNVWCVENSDYSYIITEYDVE